MRNRRKDFEKMIEDGRLASGYIFYGPDLEDQWRFVCLLANFLETGKWEDGVRALSDARLISQEGKLGIDLARAISGFLYQAPNVSAYRLVAVRDGSRLNHLAQNAILKIAEEPPESGILILTASDVGSISPILASRFNKVFFPREKSATLTQSKEAVALVRDFLSGGKRDRSAFLKDLVKQDKEAPVIEDFVYALMADLAFDSEKNWRALKELSERYEKMRQYNTNKRLQLEAVLQYLD